MIFSVRMFAGARDLVGKDRVDIDIATPTTVSQVRESLAIHYPQLAPLLAFSRIAIDKEYVDESTSLSGHEELAFIPPVSGG